MLKALRGGSQRGITLVELVVTMTILSIVTAFSFGFILKAFQSQQRIEQRSVLISAADSAVVRFRQDLAHALPNSVRVTPDGRAIEFGHVVDGGLYRQGADPALVNGTPLTFSGQLPADYEFSTLNSLNVSVDSSVNPNASTWYGQSAPDRSDRGSGYFLSLYGPPYRLAIAANEAVDANGALIPGSSIYSLAAAGNPSTISTTNIDFKRDDTGTVAPSAPTPPGRSVFKLREPTHFSTPSAARRYHLINGTVSYSCRLTGGLFTLQRLQSSAASMPTAVQNSAPGGEEVLVGLTRCEFDFDPGAIASAPIASLQLELPHVVDDGSLVVFQQVVLELAP